MHVCTVPWLEGASCWMVHNGVMSMLVGHGIYDIMNTIKRPDHVSLMLPMVIYITNRIITYWGNPPFNSFGGFSSPSTSCPAYFIWICGWELHSVCLKKGTHALSMEYFLWYIAFYSWPSIIVLVPICSLYG